MKEMDLERIKNKKLSKKLKDSTSKIEDLSIQLAEAKVNEELLQLQMINKIDACCKIE